MDKNIIHTPVDILREKLLTELKTAEGGKAEIIDAMRREALETAKPAGLFTPFSPELREGEIWLNGVRFKEPFVYKMLSDSETVVPYIATCGAEIDEWSKKFTDPAERAAADKIMEICLFAMRDHLLDTVKKECFDASKNISAINPGSLKEWPLTGQIPLFAALGGAARDIGVSLSDNLWMSPVKTVSGILFQSDTAYENCQFCPRPDCPNRKAEFIG